MGHVDSGKSTLSGRLLHLLGRISQKQMHKFEKEAKSQVITCLLFLDVPVRFIFSSSRDLGSFRVFKNLVWFWFIFFGSQFGSGNKIRNLLIPNIISDLFQFCFFV